MSKEIKNFCPINYRINKIIIFYLIILIRQIKIIKWKFIKDLLIIILSIKINSQIILNMFSLANHI